MADLKGTDKESKSLPATSARRLSVQDRRDVDYARRHLDKGARWDEIKNSISEFRAKDKENPLEHASWAVRRASFERKVDQDFNYAQKQLANGEDKVALIRKVAEYRNDFKDPYKHGVLTVAKAARALSNEQDLISTRKDLSECKEPKEMVEKLTQQNPEAEKNSAAYVENTANPEMESEQSVETAPLETDSAHNNHVSPEANIPVDRETFIFERDLTLAHYCLSYGDELKSVKEDLSLARAGDVSDLHGHVNRTVDTAYASNALEHGIPEEQIRETIASNRFGDQPDGFDMNTYADGILAEARQLNAPRSLELTPPVKGAEKLMDSTMKVDVGAKIGSSVSPSEDGLQMEM